MFYRDGQCHVSVLHLFRTRLSQLPQTEDGGGLEGDELEEELMFDVDADLVALDRARLGPGAQRRRGHR